MEISAVLTLLMHGNQLKRTVRTGWAQRGVPEAENVAAHSYGTAFTAFVLAHVISEPLNLERVLAMAVLHDLPEGMTTDIPAPTWRLFPAGIKNEVEQQTIQIMVGDMPSKEHFLVYWDELQKNETAEAHLVHDCDKLDMYLQALMYEQQTCNQLLKEFWEQEHNFKFEESKVIFEEIAALRP